MSMKRDEIGGFSLCAGPWVLEIVTFRFITVCIAISNGLRTVWRVEI